MSQDKDSRALWSLAHVAVRPVKYLASMDAACRTLAVSRNMRFDGNHGDQRRHQDYMKKLRMGVHDRAVMQQGLAKARIRQKRLAAQHAIASGRVETQRTGTESQCAVWQQGDESMYTSERLIQREALRHDANIVSTLQLFWDYATYHSSCEGFPSPCVAPQPDVCLQRTLTFPMYEKIFQRIYQAVLEDWCPIDAKATIAEDWENDARGMTELTRELFFDSIFELADHWCSDIGANEYNAFIRRLLGLITVYPPGCFKCLAGIAYDSSTFEHSSNGRSRNNIASTFERSSASSSTNRTGEGSHDSPKRLQAGRHKRKAAVQTHTERRASAVKIQSRLRGKKARTRSKERRQAVSRIQAVQRGNNRRRQLATARAHVNLRNASNAAYVMAQMGTNKRQDGKRIWGGEDGASGQMQRWALRKGLPPRLQDEWDSLSEAEQDVILTLPEAKRSLLLTMNGKSGQMQRFALRQGLPPGLQGKWDSLSEAEQEEVQSAPVAERLALIQIRQVRSLIPPEHAPEQPTAREMADHQRGRGFATNDVLGNVRHARAGNERRLAATREDSAKLQQLTAREMADHQRGRRLAVNDVLEDVRNAYAVKQHRLPVTKENPTKLHSIATCTCAENYHIRSPMSRYEYSVAPPHPYSNGSMASSVTKASEAESKAGGAWMVYYDLPSLPFGHSSPEAAFSRPTTSATSRTFNREVLASPPPERLGNVHLDHRHQAASHRHFSAASMGCIRSGQDGRRWESPPLSPLRSPKLSHHILLGMHACNLQGLSVYRVSRTNDGKSTMAGTEAFNAQDFASTYSSPARQPASISGEHARWASSAHAGDGFSGDSSEPLATAIAASSDAIMRWRLMSSASIKTNSPQARFPPYPVSPARGVSPSSPRQSAIAHLHPVLRGRQL